VLERSLSDGVVSIRPPTAADVPILVAGQDAELVRFLGEGAAAPEPIACVVVDGEVVGWVDYDHDRSWLEADEVNVGYSTVAEHRRKGYATRAVLLLLDHLRLDTDWAVATLLIHPENARSLAVARRAGFTQVGDLDGHPYWKKRIRVVPRGFEPPQVLVTERFRLEPLGPQHNESDHAAWTSSIDHVRSTPGFPNGGWPPPEGMSLEQNLDDLRRHAADFEALRGFTFTVLAPGTDDVIGCVYVYPSRSSDADVTVRSWVSADHAELDLPLADAVATWLEADWPWERVDRPGR
jgi:L-amino acid N-acyltransferase YncA